MWELKTISQWVMWKYETVKGKKQKVLYSAMTKRHCGANAKYCKVWVPYEEAVRVAADNAMEGVGFVVPKGYIAFDFDHCVQDDPMLKRAHELLPSYTEKSPSGSGEHIICKVDASKLPQCDGKWDPDYYMKNSHIGAEAYAGDLTSRYVTYTGNEIGTHDICDCTDGILTFLEEYMRKSLYKKASEKSPEMGTDEYLPLGDLDIVCIARRAKNAEKFIALHDEGDISGYGSASEADLAECSILAFYAGGNEDTIDRLHREGKLYREKWEREDYRRETIKKAVKLCNGNFYTGHRPMTDFVGFNKNGKPFIICPKLAEYFRNNYRLISVRDGGKGGVNRYLYRDGCYRIIADDMLKGVIKSIIMDTDPCLLQMRDVNEVFQQIVTDLNFMTNDQLNTEENLINFTNGLLDINTLELLPHDPDVISTIQLPCEWSGTEKPTPVFDRFMMTLLSRDEDVIELMLEFMGVCISNIKGWRMKKALFMVGDGDTGKSKLKSLTEMLLGKGNHVAMDLGEIEARFGTSNIYGKRLAGSSDMSFMTVTELKTFKKCTGGDSLYAEYKGENGFEFVYDGMLWFCMNRLPKFGGDDGQWVYQRIMQVSCNNVIPKEKQDPFLLDKLYEERTGIVYKLVMALRNVIANGYRFAEPQSVLNAREEYHSENNTVISFWKECMVLRPDTKIDDMCTTGRVFRVYKEWCRDNNHGFAKTMKEFRRDLSGYCGMDYTDMIVRHGKGGSFFREYTLSDEMKDNYRSAYGYDDIQPLVGE